MSEQEKINTKNNTKSHTSDTNEMIEKFVEHVRKQFNDSSYPVEYEDFELRRNVALSRWGPTSYNILFQRPSRES